MPSPIRVHRCRSSASVRCSSDEDDLELLGLGARGVGHRAGLLELGALVHEQRRVAAVVEDHVRALAAATSSTARCTTSTPRASRPSRRTPARRAAPRACRPGRRRSPRPRGPGWRRCCTLHQRTSAPSAVSVSMRTAVWIVMCSEPDDPRAPQRLGGRELLAHRHQAGHLVLGEADLLAAELGEREVGDLVVGRGQRAGVVVVMRSPGRWSSGRRPRRASASCFSCSQRSQSSAGTSSGRRGSAASQRLDGPRRPASSRSRAAKPDVGQADARSARAARAGCAGAGARPARRAGSPRPSGPGRRARRARCSAASAATSRSSRPPRGSSARPSTAPTLPHRVKVCASGLPAARAAP